MTRLKLGSSWLNRVDNSSKEINRAASAARNKTGQLLNCLTKTGQFLTALLFYCEGQVRWGQAAHVLPVFWQLTPVLSALTSIDCSAGSSDVYRMLCRSCWQQWRHWASLTAPSLMRGILWTKKGYQPRISAEGKARICQWGYFKEEGAKS